MIKRNGVEIMNSRTRNVSIANETIKIIKQKNYTTILGKYVDISNEVDNAINNTILYKEQLPIKSYSDNIKPTIEVINETTTNAARRLLSLGKKDIVALNFASGRNVGGGFLSGAIAQEEDLCRSSALYECIRRKPVYYNENILCDNHLYTDNIIYSPNVPFFRSDDLSFLDEPYLLSIITAPAPCVRSLDNVDETLLYNTIYNRAVKIIQIAEENKHKNIILGAWGAGAYGNDPYMIAKIFMDILEKVAVFEHICFAVYDTKPEQLCFNAFKEVCLKS